MGEEIVVEQVASNEEIIIKDTAEELSEIQSPFGKKKRRKRDVTHTDLEENLDDKVDTYEKKKNAAEGMMDIALLSANSNQLRFVLTYNSESPTFYVSLVLIALSLTLQVFVGIALILKRKKRSMQSQRRDQFLVAGVFIVTFINILITAFTTTPEDENKNDK